jgi:hypothetical protein
MVVYARSKVYLRIVKTIFTANNTSQSTPFAVLLNTSINVRHESI